MSRFGGTGVVLGIDIGGSHVTSLLMNTEEEILHKNTIQLENREVVSVIDAIVSSTKPFSTSLSSIRSTGLGVPGNVDPKRNIARFLPNFPWERDVPIGDLIKEALNLDPACVITMRNDGRCAAIAEHKYGAGRNSQFFAALTLGTGIGGALIINGKLFDGCSFDAGDFGHHVIRSSNEDAFDCACGKRGCFETQASAQGLVRHFQHQQRIADESASEKCIRFDRECLNAEDVMMAMRGGDEIATVAFENYLTDLATGLANLVTFYNPDVIALGGGLSQAPELFHDLQDRVDANTLPATRKEVRVVPSGLGTDAGAIGAALLALSVLA